MPDQPCPNDSGECCMPGCEETDSPLWYNRGLPKKCQACYRKDAKRRKLEACSPRSVVAVEESAGDVPLEILRVYGYRHAAPRNSHPAPPAPSAFADRYRSVCAAQTRR